MVKPRDDDHEEDAPYFTCYVIVNFFVKLIRPCPVPRFRILMQRKNSKNKGSKSRQIQMDIMDPRLSQKDHFQHTGIFINDKSPYQYKPLKGLIRRSIRGLIEFLKV